MHVRHVAMVIGTACLVLSLDAEAQEPVLLATPEMRSLRELQRRESLLMQARREAIEAARIRIGAVPTKGIVSLSGDLEETDVTNPINNTARVAIEREFVPRVVVDAAVGRARANLALEEARLSAVVLAQSLDLEQHAIEAAVWDRIRSRLVEEDSLLVRASATLNARFATGETRYVDVIRMRTERIRVQTEIAEATAHAQAARLRLIGLTGHESTAVVGTALRSVTNLPIPELPTLEQLIALAPSVQIANAEIAIARQELAVAASQSARRWSAGVGLQRFEGSSGYTLGPVLMGSLTLPVHRSARNAQIAAATRDTVVSNRLLTALASTLRSEAEASRAEFAAARQRFEGVDLRLLAAAREERESALISYATGELTLIELLDFERALARAEIQRLESYLDMADAWMDLWRAAATGEHGEEHR